MDVHLEIYWCEHLAECILGRPLWDPKMSSLFCSTYIILDSQSNLAGYHLIKSFECSGHFIKKDLCNICLLTLRGFNKHYAVDNWSNVMAITRQLLR